VLAALAFGLAANAADRGVIEEVVVTGSYIKGTPENAELLALARLDNAQPADCPPSSS
jgi:hypothetical protein